jgi:hypothetical protein
MGICIALVNCLRAATASDNEGYAPQLQVSGDPISIFVLIQPRPNTREYEHLGE